MKNLNRLVAVGVLGCLTAFGAGFSILEQSVSGMGRALAGMTAETTDPSSLYFNPSANAWIKRPSLMVGAHILTGDCKFDDKWSNAPGGCNSGDFIGTTVIPNLAFVYPISEEINFGLAVSATSGTETNYPWDWKGRYNAVNTSIAMIEVQPSISIKLTDNLAIGFGLLLQYASMDVDQALPYQGYGTDTRDTRMYMDGNTTAYGFTLGITWKPFEHTTLGLGYRSGMNYSMDMNVDYANGMSSIYAYQLGGRAHMNLKMPQVINLGIVQEINDKWRVMADASWTDWSCMEQMCSKFSHGVESTEYMKWHDSWRFSLGTDYKLTEKWTVRCGVAFDERAVTNPSTKTCKMPDSNRYWASCGFSYQFTESLRFDFAWTHIIFERARLHQECGDGVHYLDGQFYGYTDLVSLGIKYDF